MITLHNITTQPLIGLYGDRKNPKVCKRNFRLIKDLELTDYGKLKEYYGLQEILSHVGSSEISFDDGLKELIINTEEEVQKTNLGSKKPKIYDVDDAIMYKGQVLQLKQIDKNVSPLSLLFGSPFEYVSYHDSYDRIGYYPRSRLLVGPDIFTIKHLLSHCTTSGLNAYTYYCPDAGDITAEFISNALKMYQEQVVRQLGSFTGELTDENLSKIFHLNMQEKMGLIEQQYSEIIDYLSEHDSFVWGSIPPIHHTSKFGKHYYTEQDIMYKSSHGKTIRDRSNKYNMIRLLSEYVTLEEAENGLLEEQGPKKAKVLDRFIK